jgi:type III secretion system chaperone SycN
MTAPGWIASLVGDFGKAAGLSSLSLNGRGTAAIAFENGFGLRFEYVEGELVVAVTVPAYLDAMRAKALLAYSHPEARLGFRVRAGYLPRQGTAVFAIRLQEREVTLPMVNQAFAVLWRIAQEFGGER